MSYFDGELLDQFLRVHFDLDSTSQIQSSTPPSPTESSSQTSSDYISISTAFPISGIPDHPEYGTPNTILRSIPESTYFYVHRNKLLECSTTHFGFLIIPSHMPPLEEGATPVLISVSETSQVLNCFLHIIYDLPLAHYMPTLDIITQALDSLTNYGCPLQPLFSDTSNIAQYLVQRAYASPLEGANIFALAAYHSIETLAVIISSTTLSSLPMSSINVELAEKMGPYYLMRLYNLHMKRRDELRRLMIVSPNTHEDTLDCTESIRSHYFRAYALAAARVTWYGLTDSSISPGWIALELETVLPLVTCPLCLQNIRKLIQWVSQQWATVKRTI